MNSVIKSLLSVFAVSILTACGGGSSSSDPAPQPKFASFKLAITDAPVDGASKVVVEFTSVTLKPASGGELEFELDEPMSIDLLDLQGTLSEVLIEETIEAGDYNWIRLGVNAELDGTLDSYIEFEDGNSYELYIPSGAETGLKLNRGFTAAADGTVDLTIDFDLRKSITDPQGQDGYKLRPTLRIVDNLVVGSLAGLVMSETLNELCEDPSTEVGAVYVFSGADAELQDVQGNDADPITTALVELTSTSDYGYEVGFLAEGDYTVAYTCDAALDDPEAADELTFTDAVNVSITADTETRQDF